MDKPAIVRSWCEQRIGCPYVYGGTGQPCTPSYRQARMNQYPAYAEKIRRNCQRLSGKSSTCTNCKWYDTKAGTGRNAYDCAQLSRWAMDAVDIHLVSGANPQWEQTKWVKRGEIDTLPANLVCLIFRYDADKGKMGHVGVYQGDGYVIHARGHDWGVVRQSLNDVNFTHWGIPVGLYEEVDIPVDNHPTLKKGSEGEWVKNAQTLLILLGYLPVYSDSGKPNSDGIFGPRTEAAVIKFQEDAGLLSNGVAARGIVDSATWRALEKEASHDPDEDSEPEPDHDVLVDEYIMVKKSDFDELKQLCTSLSKLIGKYNTVG